jgi:polysaccharide export outer membrane protein
MTTRRMNYVVSQLRFLSTRRETGGPTDADLVERFLAHREEAAFESLVQRHGPMVHGVCRRLLDDEHDAEDAFQATFLVLFHKAPMLRPGSCVGPWLYGVARRTALKARSLVLRRRRAEAMAGRQRSTVTTPTGGECDLRPLLDEELERLPAKYRDPLILCLLQGKARKEAARLLGWTEGTLSGRLARGKEMLGERLRRRGVEPSAAIGTGIHVPVALTAATVKAAVSLPGPAAGSLAGPVVALMEEVLKSMVTMKLKAVVGVLVLVVGLGFGTGLAAWQRGQGAQGAVPPEAVDVARQPVTTDRQKDTKTEYVIEPPDILLVRYGAPEGADPVKISGSPLVRPDGTIGLGPLGSVMVSGCTLREAHAAIAKHLRSQLDAFDAAKLTVDVKEYNSKFVYVIIQDAGEQVVRLPASRSCKTVLDALVKAHEIRPILIGLGKKRVHIERKADGDGAAQVLLVDFHAIMHDGDTATNHTLQSGDRIFIGSAGRREVPLLLEDPEARRLPRPTLEDVARALPKTWANAQLKSVTFAVLSHRVEEPRMYPLVGRARLARTHWKCTVFGDKGVETVYFDRDFLILCK